MLQTNIVKGRLAATHLVSFIDEVAASRKGIDYVATVKRLAPWINDSDINRWHSSNSIKKHISVAEMLAEECVKVLQDAPLTINFEPYKLFEHKVKGDRVQSVWSRLSSKVQGYGDVRDQAENLMFGYDKGDHVVSGLDVGKEIRGYGSRVGLGPDGRPKIKSFVADMRPKYAAVNFTWATDGAACLYGQSHFVLKNHLRFNTVFSPYDSFNVSDRNQLGTYFQMYPVLANCADFVLKQILESGRNRVPPSAPNVVPSRPIQAHEEDKGGYGTPGMTYIEAILHTDVVFSRDVQYVRVANSEMRDKRTADSDGRSNLRTVRMTTMEKNLRIFLEHHNLTGALVRF
jgi:hypothetical protein